MPVCRSAAFQPYFCLGFVRQTAFQQYFCLGIVCQHVFPANQSLDYSQRNNFDVRKYSANCAFSTRWLEIDLYIHPQHFRRTDEPASTQEKQGREPDRKSVV